MQQRILVVGTGFAGLWSALAAKGLISASSDIPASQASEIEVVVIAPEPSLVVRPRLYEENPESMTAPLAQLFHSCGIRFIKGIVDTIRTAEHDVTYVDRFGTRSTIDYDRLVLAAGSRLARPSIPGLSEHAFSVDQIDEAAELDVHLKGLSTLPQSPARDTVVICGGGFTGIEIAAELPQRLHTIMGKDSKVRVIVVDSHEEVGGELGPGPRPVITEALKELGVETKLGSRIASIDAIGVVTEAGERIDTLTPIWTAGMKATGLTEQIPSKRDQFGRLVVDQELRVPSIDGVFATGDAAVVNTDEDDHKVMMSCQHALFLGRSAGYNAAADLLGVKATLYSQPYYGTCLDLGSFGAVVTSGWDRKVTYTRERAKTVKNYINRKLIYPPPPTDAAQAFALADPAIKIPPLSPETLGIEAPVVH